MFAFLGTGPALRFVRTRTAERRSVVGPDGMSLGAPTIVPFAVVTICALGLPLGSQRCCIEGAPEPELQTQKGGLQELHVNDAAIWARPSEGSDA